MTAQVVNSDEHTTYVNNIVKIIDFAITNICEPIVSRMEHFEKYGFKMQSSF